LSVELTDEGINHIDDVVSCCFSYIGMLLKAGPEEWILQEMKETAEMNFRFMEKTDAASYVTKLANSMQVVICVVIFLYVYHIGCSLRFTCRG
jgi:insulysin